MDNSKKNIKSRRDFLKSLGYSFGAISIGSSCQRTVEKLIPHFYQPDNYVPGDSYRLISNHYNNSGFAGIELTMIDGRPIQINGNHNCPISRGSLNHNIQSSLLQLYWENRASIKSHDNYFEWVPDKLISELKDLQKNNKRILILTPPRYGASVEQVIGEFSKMYNTEHYEVFDTISDSVIQEAYSDYFRKVCNPVYEIKKANIIVSFEDDFLNSNNWKTKYISDYATRKNDKSFSHYQFESKLSLSGINSTSHQYIKPSEIKDIILQLYKFIVKGLPIENAYHKFNIQGVAEKLIANRGKSVITVKSTSKEVQNICLALNQYLNNIDSTITLRILSEKRSNIFNLKDIENHSDIGAVIFWKCNPVYLYPYFDWKTFTKNIDLIISINYFPDESSVLANRYIPCKYYLEEWNEFYPVQSWHPICQPIVASDESILQAEDILLQLTGSELKYSEIVKNTLLGKNTRNNIDQESIWGKTLSIGGLETKTENGTLVKEQNSVQIIYDDNIVNNQNNDFEISIVNDGKIVMPDDAINPWIQELPDPVTKTCWEHFATVGENVSKKYRLNHGDVVLINEIIEIPVFLSSECHPDVISIPVNYGRNFKGLNDNLKIGINSNILLKENSNLILRLKSLSKTNKEHTFCQSQQYFTDENEVLNPKNKSISADIYPKREYKSHHWHMVINLEKCIGCGSCTIACQNENNIPVVGRDEVAKGHEMHWLTVFRVKDNIVKFLPLMCQHCDNAPCENVCPVNATVHSSEGINQMVYNRCIGARYCSSNCPYKIRRFNWRDYNGADAIENNTYDPLKLDNATSRLILNPEVTTRAKGVNEKCSFCIQRIQKSKLEAKLKDQDLTEDSTITACQQVCPADAISFGDLNNKEFKNKTNHNNKIQLLDHLNTKPSVTYLIPDEQQ